MCGIAANLREIQSEIAAACEKAGRPRAEVTLVAVSKTFPAESIQSAAEAGQAVFGESKLQEAEGKIAVLPEYLEWHFIGRVQRNKVRKILPLFPVIHGIDSVKLAAHVSTVAKELGLRPKLFLQVNVAGEASKGGFFPAELSAALPEILTLESIEVLGLMTIPPADEEEGQTCHWFAELRQLRDELEKKFSISLPALSMGMSGDFQLAIQEGATHVRIGSAIFGKRTYRVDGELG